MVTISSIISSSRTNTPKTTTAVAAVHHQQQQQLRRQQHQQQQQQQQHQQQQQQNCCNSNSTSASTTKTPTRTRAPHKAARATVRGAAAEAEAAAALNKPKASTIDNSDQHPTERGQGLQQEHDTPVSSNTSEMKFPVPRDTGDSCHARIFANPLGDPQGPKSRDSMDLRLKFWGDCILTVPCSKAPI